MNPYRHLPKSPVYDEGYVSDVKEWPWGVEQTTIIPKGVHGCPSATFLQVALNPEGQYIGSAEDANHMWDKYGIIPSAPGKNEDGSPKKTCSTGKGRDGKWYGWSHRAIYGFQIGDTMEPGCSGYMPSTVEEMYDAQYQWHGWDADDEDKLEKHDLSIKVIEKDGMFEVTHSYGIARGGNLEDIVQGKETYMLRKGRGVWTATTEEGARSMAEDFAESVSKSIEETEEATASTVAPVLLTKQEFLESFHGF